MNLTEEITAALATNLTTRQCVELLAKLTAKEGETTQRIAAIRPAKNFEGAGPERVKVQLSGTIDDLRKLDNEFADLILGKEQLKAQAQELSNRRTEVMAKEAAEGLPRSYKSLASKLAAAEAARDAIKDALTAIDQEYNTITQMRARAIRGGHKAAAGNDEMVRRIEALIPWGSDLKLRVFSRGMEYTEDLGVPEQHEQARHLQRLVS